MARNDYYAPIDDNEYSPFPEELDITECCIQCDVPIQVKNDRWNYQTGFCSKACENRYRSEIKKSTKRMRSDDG